MGKEHVGDDEEVDREKIREIDKRMNEHSRAWCSIWRTGEHHDHGDRVVASKMTRSENTAKLYLVHKDHKKGAVKTRPIGTGNTSNTLGFANSVSDFMESVANCERKKYEVISSEDMLHHTKVHNESVEKVMEDWKERKRRKERCRSCRIWRKRCKICIERRIVNTSIDTEGQEEEGKLPEIEKEGKIKEILEDVIWEVIMTGRMEKQEEVEDCNDCKIKIKEAIEKDCNECGRGLWEEEKELVMVGMDAVALFPSLSGEETARIVRRKVEESRIKADGFNWKKAMLYIKIPA